MLYWSLKSPEFQQKTFIYTFHKIYFDLFCFVNRCTAPSLVKRRVAIARLKGPANLGRTSQEVHFIILVLTPTKEVSFAVPYVTEDSSSSALFNKLVLGYSQLISSFML